jgi:hypothetical protein
LYGYPQPHVQPKVSGKIVQARKKWKPKIPNARKRKTPNVSSSVTSSESISVPPVLTKSGNLVQSVHKPYSMSKLYVEPLKNSNVEPNVKLSGMVSIVADNVDTSKKIARKTGNLDNLRSIETLGQSSLNVADVDKKDGLESDDQSVWSYLLF